MTRLRRIEAADLKVLATQYDGSDRAITADDGTSVGELQWRRSLNGPSMNGACWNLGIWIAPEHRNIGHGSDAQRLGAAYWFNHTMMERVEASTESGNVAEQRALEKAGFSRDGVLRRACFRAGAWRDVVLFSKLRGEV